MDKFIFDGEHTFFTSDTHFGHTNIINLCKRPFNDVREMNETLIENWNKTVSKDDTVFHLGDFAIGGSYIWNSVLGRLNGRIILIKGNHEMKNLRNSYINKFHYITNQLQIQIEERSIYLNHYPFLCYGGTYRSSKQSVWQLFGHVHSGPGASGLDIKRMEYLFPTQYDVGVDNNNFTPISWNEVKNIINRQIEKHKDGK